jgi:hypothetical protein
MKEFLIGYGIFSAICMILSYIALRNAQEVPQDIDIYDL